MLAIAPYLLNALAIGVLVFALYVPRHRRRDLVAAYLGVNVGVLAVSTVLMDSAIGAGLGLGLFGVLSIIRLRSDELAQHEVAYYFCALALGLIGGLAVGPLWLTAVLMALIVATMFFGDHPRLLQGLRRQLLVLDGAYVDEAALKAHLAQRLGADIVGLSASKLDLVNDTTTVEVRYRVRPAPPAIPMEPAATSTAAHSIGAPS